MTSGSERKPGKTRVRDGLFNLIATESDRGAALVAGEALNELLEALLLSVFVEDKVSRKLLEGAGGALATFSARTCIAFALGLLSEDEHHDLNLVRKIRNGAAHFNETNVFSFESERTAEECARLRVPLADYMQVTSARVLFIWKFVGLHYQISRPREGFARREVPPARPSFGGRGKVPLRTLASQYAIRGMSPRTQRTRRPE
jgi:hypothetical protein